MCTASAAESRLSCAVLLTTLRIEEKKHFWKGEGCPCCYGKPLRRNGPFRCDLQDALESVLGDDHDGLAAEMEDAEMNVREEFNE